MTPSGPLPASRASRPARPLRVVSGGQTGVDRAALDAALAAGLPCGGWCPLGRWAEDGAIPPRYPLRETPSPEPAERTAWNARDSDATLALVRGAPAGGTVLALEKAREHGRPTLCVDLASGAATDARGDARLASIRAWLVHHGVRALNVAGPRESEAPGIHAEVLALLGALFRELRDLGDEPPGDAPSFKRGDGSADR